MLSVRQIKQILKSERIAISKRRGQNFLICPRVQKRIIDAVGIKPTDQLLEIGPGLGALTEDLAKGAGSVIAVEKDRGLARILAQRSSNYKNLQIICADILKVDLEKIATKKLKVVGNLPYYITTPIIGYLLEKQRDKIKEIFITVQEELGRRLVAKVASKDYAAITLFVQYFTQGSVIFSIPKRAFYPQPKVNSVFVRLGMLNQPAFRVNNQEQLFKIIRSCFSQRRKTIVNSLAHKLKEKNKIVQLLTKEGIDCQSRPQTLSLAEFAKIEDILYNKGLRLE